MQKKQYAFAAIDAVAKTQGAQRVIEGVATTPTEDRDGEIVLSSGAEFKGEVPLLLFHDQRQPVGNVRMTKGPGGIRFKAKIAEAKRPGKFQERVDEAFDMVEAGVIRGVSIGFRPLEASFDDSGRRVFEKFELLELSLVAIPSNPDAAIETVKALDALPDHFRKSVDVRPKTHRKPITKGNHPMLPKEKLDFQKSRLAELKADATEITDASEDGSFTDEQTTQLEDNLSEQKAVERNIAILQAQVEASRSKARNIKGASPEEASESRSSVPAYSTQTKSMLPPGVGFARKCRVTAVAKFESSTPLEVAKAMYPSDDGLHAALDVKAAVAGAVTTADAWAGYTAAPQLSQEFLEYLQPMTILDRVSGWRGVDFNVEVPKMTTPTTGYWVGEGAHINVSKGVMELVTLGKTKVAGMITRSREQFRFATPRGDERLRDDLARAVAAKMDASLVDTVAGSASRPAGLLNGVTVTAAPAGTDADAARQGMQDIFDRMSDANIDDENAVILTTSKIARALSLMHDLVGAPSFPGMDGARGGRTHGYTVIGSQHVPAGHVIGISPNNILLADDGDLEISASDQATIISDDAPTANLGTGAGQAGVSMFQSEGVAIKVVRFVNWVKGRDEAVQAINGVTWNGTSPTSA